MVRSSTQYSARLTATLILLAAALGVCALGTVGLGTSGAWHLHVEAGVESFHSHIHLGRHGHEAVPSVASVGASVGASDEALVGDGPLEGPNKEAPYKEASSKAADPPPTEGRLPEDAESRFASVGGDCLPTLWTVPATSPLGLVATGYPVQDVRLVPQQLSRPSTARAPPA